MPNKYIFTITTGRSGSVFLTNLLSENTHDSIVFHERTNWDTFGEVTPDLSHFTLFNSVGNVQKVRDFWKRKFTHDKKFEQSTYIETSHYLSKAGLVENLNLLTPDCDEIHIIIQRRDIFKIVWSLYNRNDFANLGFTWAFYLDPRYPNVIINSKQFMKHGAPGYALWYVFEMFTRAEYYKILYKDNPKITIHDIDLDDISNEANAKLFLSELGYPLDEISMPKKANDSPHFPYQNDEAKVRNLVAAFTFEPRKIALTYINSGKRLENPTMIHKTTNTYN
jgi:hypothetical protein